MLQDIFTAFWRDWVVLKHRMIKFILSRMVAPILYLVAFGWGLGRSIHTTSGSYLDFLVPGILALNSMNISFNSLAPLHGERIYHKSIEEYFTAPINPLSFAAGKILAAILRGMISSLIIIVLSYAFGANFTITPLFIIILLLNCAIFAEIGYYAAMTIASYEDMGRFNTYILLPMSFLCGTFFSTSKLPAALYYFIHALPLTHTSLLLRSIGRGEPAAIFSLIILLIYTVGCFLLCAHVTTKAQK
ncbi:ABC transporter permease [Pectinatus brassicae]|uniref:Transport permease protein n=1 Tax=Pectinatus brassicae TaxID=862415 RepID=A0A840UD31_9FIRM|nr:ABC transporter permease [Pectinatus brassicae]MBB5334986.1 ABC-type multidrug transport system permease subunit [Pectinatus brassicae]